MIIFGITGGVGMGKSASERLLHERGVLVVDTDQLAREFVEPGQSALAEIVARFGREVLDNEGSLRREFLARKVFADESARRDLEAILHPRIRQRWREQLESWRRERRPRAAVVIPLLFETGAQQEFDCVVCVACTRATQEARLRERGWNDEQIRQRIASQISIEEKLARADFVVWTEGDLASHAAQWDHIFKSVADGTRQGPRIVPE